MARWFLAAVFLLIPCARTSTMKPVELQELGDVTLETGHQVDSGDYNAPADQLVRRKVVLLRVATRTLRRLKIDETQKRLPCA